MRRIIYLLILTTTLLTGEVISQSAWVQQESNTSGWLMDVFFVNALTGYTADSDSNTVLKTTNGGASWESQSINPLGVKLGIYFVNSSLGFIVSYDRSFRTTNGGNNWSQMTLPGGICDVVFLNSLLGYTAGNDVKKTTDGGLTWVNASGASMSLYNVFALNENILFFGAGGSYFYKTTNGGSNLQQHGLTSIPNRLCFLNELTGYAACDHYIVKTTTGGANWEWTTQLYSYRTFFNDIVMLNQDTGYAIGNNSFESILGKVYKTTNSGQNWNLIYTAGIDLTALHFLNESTGYIVGKNGTILKTTTGGELITHTISGIVRLEDNNQPVNSGKVKALKYNYQTHQIITVDSAVIQSNGTYILNNVPEDSTDIMAFQDDEDNNEFVPTYYPSTIYWQNSATLYPTSNLNNININVYRNFSPLNNMHIGGKVTGNYYSDMANLADVYVYAKIGNQFKGYSLSNTNALYEINKLNPGTYEIIADKMGYNPASRNVQLISSSFDNIDISMFNYVIAVEPVSEVIPKSYSLSQNFPNPFNPVTKISFEIPPEDINNNNTIIKIYDVLGSEIETLVSAYLKPGKYQVVFNAQNYPSGLYFYSISSGKFYETKKMILIK